MKRPFEQFQEVRIVGFGASADLAISSEDERAPRIGDIATIIAVYDDPLGYELECSDPERSGTTIWLHAFRASDVQLELLTRK